MLMSREQLEQVLAKPRRNWKLRELLQLPLVQMSWPGETLGCQMLLMQCLPQQFLDPSRRLEDLEQSDHSSLRRNLSPRPSLPLLSESILVLNVVTNTIHQIQLWQHLYRIH